MQYLIFFLWGCGGWGYAVAWQWHSYWFSQWKVLWTITHNRTEHASNRNYAHDTHTNAHTFSFATRKSSFAMSHAEWKKHKVHRWLSRQKWISKKEFCFSTCLKARNPWHLRRLEPDSFFFFFRRQHEGWQNGAVRLGCSEDDLKSE